MLVPVPARHHDCREQEEWARLILFAVERHCSTQIPLILEVCDSTSAKAGTSWLSSPAARTNSLPAPARSSPDWHGCRRCVCLKLARTFLSTLALHMHTYLFSCKSVTYTCQLHLLTAMCLALRTYHHFVAYWTHHRRSGRLCCLSRTWPIKGDPCCNILILGRYWRTRSLTAKGHRALRGRQQSRSSKNARLTRRLGRPIWGRRCEALSAS